MTKLYNQTKDRGLVVLAIDVREKKGTVKEYVEKQKVPFPVLLDTDGKIASEYGIRGYPTHFLIDRQRRLIGAGIGPKNWQSKESKNLIRYLVEQKG